MIYLPVESARLQRWRKPIVSVVTILITSFATASFIELVVTLTRVESLSFFVDSTAIAFESLLAVSPFLSDGFRSRWNIPVIRIESLNRALTISIVILVINWGLLPMISLQLYNAGSAARLKGDYNHALLWLQNATRLETGLFRIINTDTVTLSTFELGDTYENLGNFEQAKTLYTDVLTRDSCYFEANWRLAQLHIRDGQYDLAHQVLDSGLRVLNDLMDANSQNTFHFCSTRQLTPQHIADFAHWLYLTRARVFILQIEADRDGSLLEWTPFAALGEAEHFLEQLTRLGASPESMDRRYMRYHYWSAKAYQNAGLCKGAQQHFIASLRYTPEIESNSTNIARFHESLKGAQTSCES